MDYDPGRSLGSAGLLDRIGHLVEADDAADARHRVEPSLDDRVEHAVPVLRHRAATELQSQSVARCLGDAQRVAGVPAAGAVDPRHELRLRTRAGR